MNPLKAFLERHPVIEGAEWIDLPAKELNAIRPVLFMLGCYNGKKDRTGFGMYSNISHPTQGTIAYKPYADPASYWRIYLPDVERILNGNTDTEG